MTKIKILTILMLVSSILYGENSVTTWSPHYDNNNINVSQTLCIEGADNLIVTISGETERNFDFITIDERRFSGSLSEEFEASGPCVTANFTTDSSVIRGEGPTVTIAQRTVVTQTWIPEYKETGRSESSTKLCIEGAEFINVKITGETEENHDFITLSGTSNRPYPHQNEEGRYEKSFSGHLNVWTISVGPCVNLHFLTDFSIKTGVGPTVTVTEANITPLNWEVIWKPNYEEDNFDESIEICNFIEETLFPILFMEGTTEEDNDFLTINNKVHLSGSDFTYNVWNHKRINGHCVKLRFQTNDSIIQGTGPTVHLEVPFP